MCLDDDVHDVTYLDAGHEQLGPHVGHPIGAEHLGQGARHPRIGTEAPRGHQGAVEGALGWAKTA